MDAADLRQKVEDAVRQKITAQESFTNVDISHPLIAEDPAVRHNDVKEIINDMQRNGEFRNAGYRVSKVTVEPSPGQTATARLFHPDSVDPSTYTATQQELKRSSPAPLNPLDSFYFVP